MIVLDTTPREKWRFRFSVRSLLYAVVLLALLLTFGPRIYEWYYAGPSDPLGDAVASFNARYKDDPIGGYETPVTEAEIIASIRSQLPNLPASGQVKSIYSDIVRTRRLPRDVSLSVIPGWVLSDGTHHTVWWIDLYVPTGKNSGFTLRIRENNAPMAKPKDEPKLERSSHMWIPETPE